MLAVIYLPYPEMLGTRSYNVPDVSTKVTIDRVRVPGLSGYCSVVYKFTGVYISEDAGIWALSEILTTGLL